MLSATSGFLPFFLPLFLCIFISCDPGAPVESPPLRVYFIDVGQGDACLLRTPGNRSFLYDIGNRPAFLPAFLTKAGVDTLETVFITHPDLDHYGSFTTLFQRIPVKKVVLPPRDSPNPAWREFMRVLDAAHIQRDTLFSGDSRIWEPGLHAKVLWPPKHYSGSDNDISLVLRVEHRGGNLLLTGDIEADAEQGLMISGFALETDILKVSHHGSRTSSTLPFLAGSRPSWAIISCDSAVYGHPHSETLAGLDLIIGNKERILRTDREGTVAFEVDDFGVRRVGEE